MARTEQKRLWQIQYDFINRDKISLNRKAHRAANKEKYRLRGQLYYEKNKETILKKTREYVINNIETVRVRKNKYVKKRAANDPLYKLQALLRARTRSAFKAKKLRKSNSTEELLGISLKIAKEYIEKQFKKGMSWQNHGEWEIDHKIPLSSANTKEELIVLCHYKNLQPLWKKDNRDKRDKILPIQVQLTI